MAQEKNYKKLKYSNITLLIIAILLLACSTFINYSFFQSTTQNAARPSLMIYLGILLIVFLVPVLTLISLLVCLIFMFKNKPWAYSMTGFVSLYLLGEAIKTVTQINIKLNFATIIMIAINLMFWIALIVLSFYMFIKTKNLQNKHKKVKKK